MSSFRNGPELQANDNASKLPQDLDAARHLNRRKALGLFGFAGGSIALAACGSKEALSAPAPDAGAMSNASSSSTSCPSYSSETKGPFPADGTNRASGPVSNALTNETFNRSDLRASQVSTNNVAAGIELNFTITLEDVNNHCAPLEGYCVYIWHADSEGRYSLYNLPDEDYLRGLQISNGRGEVRFTTIIPGTYRGRYPHIHFEVFSSMANARSGKFPLLVSQFALPKSELTAIYASHPAYSGSVSALERTTLARDYVFADNSAEQQQAMTVDLSGNNDGSFSASAIVGLVS